MPDKTEVPALDRALTILEAIAATGPMGFKDITDQLSLPPASVARILKRLCQRHYLAKDAETGDYIIGEAPSALTRKPGVKETLQQVGAPILAQLRDTTRQTAILFYWTGIAWECIAKEAHEDSITMQMVGETRVDIFNYPWGVFAYEQLKKENRTLVLNPDIDRLQQESEAFHKHNYVVYGKTGLRRFAVPLRSPSGDLVGVLAMGTTSSELTERGDISFADVLIAGQQQIENQLSDKEIV